MFSRSTELGRGVSPAFFFWDLPMRFMTLLTAVVLCISATAEEVPITGTIDIDLGALRGPQGERGPAGEQGPPELQGDPGEDGTRILYAAGVCTAAVDG